MITLVLGGTRSGKSRVAEDLAARVAASGGGRVAYVATAVVDPNDGDMVRRVAAHVARRPTEWSTVDAGRELAPALVGLAAKVRPGDAVLIDALGTWLAAFESLRPDVDPLITALAALSSGGAEVVVVSDEVGLGVHAPTEIGRRFTDALGEINQAVAAAADRVWLVVAGRVLPLGRPEEIA